MDETFSAKAMENIRAAELLFDEKMYNASANRSYYAALHAAVAALAKAGIRFERIDHSKVQAQFSGELIHRKKVYPSRYRSHLLDLQAVRDTADYRSKLLNRKVAGRQLNRAKEYVAALQTEVSNVQ